MTGQAAGVLAALSVKEGKQPREIKAIRVQKALLDAGVRLSLAEYLDVPSGHKQYKNVQLASLYGLIEPVTWPHDDEAGVFGIDELISSEEIAGLNSHAKAELNGNMTRAEAIDLVLKAME